MRITLEVLPSPLVLVIDKLLIEALALQVFHSQSQYGVCLDHSSSKLIFHNVVCGSKSKKWCRSILSKINGTLLLPVRSNPARLSSFSPDLKSVAHAAIKLRLRPEQSCRLQLLHGPITVVTIPNEDTAFTACVDPISPHSPKFLPF